MPQHIQLILVLGLMLQKLVQDFDKSSLLGDKTLSNGGLLSKKEFSPRGAISFTEDGNKNQNGRVTFLESVPNDFTN